MLTTLNQKFKTRRYHDEVMHAVDQQDCIATLNLDGMITYCNSNFAQLIGDSGHLIFTHLKSGETFKSEYWKHITLGKHVSEELECTSADRRYIKASFSPVLSKGQVKNIMLLACDVSIQKRALLKAEAINHALNISFPTIEFDVNGYIQDANSIFLQKMGYNNLNEIQGKHHSIFVTEAYKKSAEYQDFWKRLKLGEIEQGTFQRVTKSGDLVWLMAAYSPIKNRKGEVQSIVKIAIDTTNEKKSTDGLADLKNTIDLSFGYIQFDPQGYIIDVNENFHRLLGYEDKSTVLGKHHSIFVSKDYARSEEYLNFWRSLNAGETIQGEFQRLSKTGHDIWINAAYTPLKNAEGKVTSIIKIAADITSSKNAALQAKRDLKQEVLYNLREISSSISQIASGSREQANKTDHASAEIERAMNSAADVAIRAESITNLASKAVKDSELGEATVSDLQSTMNRLNEVATRSQRDLNKFNDRMDQVNHVLQVIQDISAQTNLLALNASIEAAQAGEYGRGFAVIAKEVRVLSENSRASANQIEELITAIREGSKEVVMSMQEVVDEVSGGLLATTNVSEIFKQMADSTNETSSVSGSILDATRLQTTGMGALVKSVESIVVISEQTAAGAEEVSAASEALQRELDNY